MSAAATPTTGLKGRPPRVLFACGGTGGHVYPAIAIADAVRAERADASIAFAGTRERMEWTAVPKAGYEIHAVAAAGIRRGFSFEAIGRNLRLPITLTRGLSDAMKLVGGFDPDVVVGTGGYVTGPVGLAAYLRRRPLAILELDAHGGVANRLLSRFARVVFVAFEAARSAFPAEKVEVAGNPVRAALATASRDEGLAHFSIPEADARVLLVMGGSLGAGPLNNAVRASLDTLLADPQQVVIWQTGPRYYDEVAAAVPAHPRLRVLPYLDRMDLAYAVADVAVCRSGAITCAELAVTGTPAVLVPSPNVVADHQTKNARALVAAGAALLVPESELEGAMERVVLPLLADVPRRLNMEESARRIARPDAARTIARRVLGLAGA
ncbi:MAG TPA: undecaprenyldiphospho-muramoylpentapeptide beta-N-acetylglucosaminyltransferase [Rhodothermales bacterium]|nr:undecaprenyldiphospho-muramoylpentapeptide beta-N-acetylglucosaminyltransferase [Rhodothermales bacterium]